MTMIDIELSAPVNLRDLGGIAIHGGVLRDGFAIRTDDLAYVTRDAADALLASGVTAIIDLRSPVEVSATGRGLLAEHAVAYHHLPLIASVAESMSGDRQAFGPAAMGEMYVRMVESAAPQLVTALNVIAYTPGATAFHCAAGRDRTGVLAAMLLLVLGASDEDIVADYARTAENMAAILERTSPVMGAMWKALGIEHDAHDLGALLDEPMDGSMRLLLDELRDRHGDALQVLRKAGLGADTVARLRERALA